MTKKAHTLRRREFVGGIGAGFAVAAGSLWVPGCSDSGESGTGGTRGGGAPDRVIVIGAGAAGLTVANALTTAGIETVVLEARDRLGGRIHSRDIGGVPIDLGGMWISGPNGNPAACVLNQEGVGWQAAEPFDFTTRGYDAVLGRELSLGELLAAADALEQFDAMFPTLVDTLGPTATAADAIAAFLAQTPMEEPARRHAEFALRTQFEVDIAQSVDLISLSSGDYSSALPGGEHFPDGSFRGLVDALARGVDIRLETAVTRITHSPDGVTVETSSGSEQGSHAVVTVPLGVLKAGAIEFSPALPAEKTTAIERLDMAELEKVVLRYDEAFWPNPGDGNFLYISEQAGELPLVVDYTRYAGGAPTMVGFYCGDYGRAIASMSDDAIAGRLAEVVEEIAGAAGPDPTDTFVTRWKSDPHAMGSYIYLPVGASVADINALAAPVGDRLLFAGEATSRRFSGYVHGAVLTGIREAERLLGREGQGVELESGLVLELGCDEEA